MATVQKTLNLSADVHSQGLSSLDLGGSQGGPRVVELLQPVLNPLHPSFQHGKISEFDSLMLLGKRISFCRKDIHTHIYTIGLQNSVKVAPTEA